MALVWFSLSLAIFLKQKKSSFSGESLLDRPMQREDELGLVRNRMCYLSYLHVAKTNLTSMREKEERST